QAGGIPVFVDVSEGDYNIDVEATEAAVTGRTRFLLPVHLYGQMADMQSIMAIARRHGLAVVEDACQAHGAKERGLRAGGVGDAAAFSFYMSKNLGAYGESGAVTTNSRAVAEQVRVLRDHGSVHKYEHHEIGVNSRLDELQAAVLRIKLRYLDAWNERRRAHAQEYDQLLDALDVTPPPTARPEATHVYHLYVVQTDERDRIREALADRGVATGVHYPIPLHRQPATRDLGRVVGDLRVTDTLARRVLSLPMYAELEPEHLGYVSTCLRACLNDCREVYLAH
ncbi:MAG: DegT/DnrJ/EryC1/StrS family aminotransferase, partial [Chloroflexi bacterium]|nr:DegT/DnrJ/EryC1/StrS family aminotransferase [Chloroflexota bacterium]